LSKFTNQSQFLLASVTWRVLVFDFCCWFPRVRFHETLKLSSQMCMIVFSGRGDGAGNILINT